MTTKKYMKIKILIFLLVSSFLSFSQEKKEIDSILAIVKTTKKDSVKVSELNKIAFKYIFSDEKIARRYLKQSENLALTKKLNFGYNEIVNIKGIFADITGYSDSAKYYFIKANALSKKNNFKTIEVRSVNNLGMYCWNKGSLKEALNYFFQAVKINESLVPEKRINESIYFNNIGLIYQELKLYEKAIDYHKKAYDIRVRGKLLKDQASSLNNLGICNRLKGNFQEALIFFNKGLIVAESSNNQIEKYKIFENLGNVYIDLGNYKLALQNHLLALNRPENLPITTASNLLLHAAVSKSYYNLKNYKKAIAFANKAYQILQQDKTLEFYAEDVYSNLAAANYAVGNISKGDQFNLKYYNLLKNNFKTSHTKDLAEMETKYQTAKKEKLLLEKEVEAKRRNNLLIVLSIFLVFITLLGYLFFHQQKLKNKQQQQEFKLKSALQQIETQNQLHEQRLSISRDLHDNIGAQLTFIISSVENLKFGFPHIEEKIKNKLANISMFTQSTITELRDTIWAMNKDEMTIEDLKNRIFNFIEKAQNSHESMHFHFRVDENLDSQTFSSLIGVNLYRVIQEAVNNVIKYANASEVVISVTTDNKKMQVAIQDNGKGFDQETVNFGNGLNNMRKRIEEINGLISVESVINKGTKIQIAL